MRLEKALFLRVRDRRWLERSQFIQTMREAHHYRSADMSPFVPPISFISTKHTKIKHPLWCKLQSLSTGNDSQRLGKWKCRTLYYEIHWTRNLLKIQRKTIALTTNTSTARKVIFKTLNFKSHNYKSNLNLFFSVLRTSRSSQMHISLHKETHSKQAYNK